MVLSHVAGLLDASYRVNRPLWSHIYCHGYEQSEIIRDSTEFAVSKKFLSQTYRSLTQTNSKGRQLQCLTLDRSPSLFSPS